MTWLSWLKCFVSGNKLNCERGPLKCPGSDGGVQQRGSFAPSLVVAVDAPAYRRLGLIHRKCAAMPVPTMCGMRGHSLCHGRSDLSRGVPREGCVFRHPSEPHSS